MWLRRRNFETGFLPHAGSNVLIIISIVLVLDRDGKRDEVYGAEERRSP